MEKNDFEQLIFKGNREMALKLQELEQYLERNMLEVRMEKEAFLNKIQGKCPHNRVLEMKDVRAEGIIPFVKNLLDSRRGEYIHCVRVCQICGLSDVQLKEGEPFIFYRLNDDRIKHAKLEHPNHSHWTPAEYFNLKPLD